MGSAPSHKKSSIRVPKWATEQDKFQKGNKFPDCQGTYPDCPKDIDVSNPVRECKICPMFKK